MTGDDAEEPARPAEDAERGRHASADEATPVADSEPVAVAGSDGAGSEGAGSDGAGSDGADEERVGTAGAAADGPVTFESTREFDAMLADFGPADPPAAPTDPSGMSLQAFLKTPVDELLDLPVSEMLVRLRENAAAAAPAADAGEDPATQPESGADAAPDGASPAADPEPVTDREPEVGPTSADAAADPDPTEPASERSRASLPEPDGPAAEDASAGPRVGDLSDDPPDGGADHTAPADEPDGPAPRASLSPTDRVVPTWTDPSATRAAALIGGPLGTHASVGRNRVFTPLRVVLAFAVIALIVGWLAKSPCIQTGANGELDQGGQKPWITGCYNDIVPLYGSRGLTDASRDPYSFSWVENGAAGPVGQVYARGDVRESSGQWVADVAGTAQVVGSADLVADPSGGYSRAEDGTLVPVPVAGQAGSLPGSPVIKHLEYPVLTGYFMWGASAVTAGYLHFVDATGLLPQPLDVGAYFTITAILLGLFYLWAVAATASMSRRRIWDVAIMGLAPLLMLHAFTNWDLLAIGFTAGGMAAWARGRRPARGDGEDRTELVQIEGGGFTHVTVRGNRDMAGLGWAVLAGVLLGLGTAAKLYPALLLGPLLVLALRAGVLRRFWFTLGGAVAAWLVVNLPIMLAYPDAWREFFALNTTRGPEWDSWYFLSSVILPTGSWWSNDAGQATPLLNSLSLVLFLIACAAIGWLALAAKRRPRFAQLAFLVVVAFLLTNKVFSPQYALWLLPLVTLALPRWRPVILWQLSEVVVWFLLMLSFDTDPGKNLPIEPFAIAATVRGALLVMLVVMVVKDIVKPERDRVRVAGDDDPSGGPLDGADDRITIPSLPTLRRRRLRRKYRVGDLDPAAEGSGLVDASGMLLNVGR